MSDEGAVLVDVARNLSNSLVKYVQLYEWLCHITRYPGKERVLFATCNIAPDGARK